MDTHGFSTSRRRFLGVGIVGAGLVSTGLLGARGVLTPPETQGPFFPVDDQEDKDTDMTRVHGHTGVAKGLIIIVSGTVKDVDAKPLPGTWIDIWQACYSGRYNHPRDTNPAPLDPNFQYWARFVTDAQGAFTFKTVKPGAYPADDGWTRPPHIHFRIDAFSHPQLTTQMYFSDEMELNDRDLILRKTEKDYGREAHDSLIIDFSKTNADGIKTGTFDIALGGTPMVD